MQRIEIVVIDKGRIPNDTNIYVSEKDWTPDLKEMEITMLLDGKFRARYIATKEKEVFQGITALWKHVFPNLIQDATH